MIVCSEKVNDVNMRRNGVAVYRKLKERFSPHILIFYTYYHHNDPEQDTEI